MPQMTPEAREFWSGIGSEAMNGLSEVGGWAIDLFGGNATTAREAKLQSQALELEAMKAAHEAELQRELLNIAQQKGGGGAQYSGNMPPAGIHMQPQKNIPNLEKARTRAGAGNKSAAGLLLLLGGGLLLAGKKRP